jgi:beta-glucanase (GH16 family)
MSVVLVAGAFLALSGTSPAQARAKSHPRCRAERRHAPVRCRDGRVHRRRRRMTARRRRTEAHQVSLTPPGPSSSPTAPTAADPSGVPMPVGNLPGWRQVFSDDFTGSALDTNLWHVYSGQPGGDPGGWWDPSHVVVQNGMLVLEGHRDPLDGNKWTTGGLALQPAYAQTYGKYLVRFRFDAGTGIAHAILLWPAGGGWPPEVDFSEDNGSNRQTDTSTLHYGASNSTISNDINVNLTQWHTFGVEWTPGKLVYTLDGKVWSTVENVNVPSIPMVMAIQTQAWSCGTSTWEQCPDSATPADVNLYVDWAVGYAMDR